MQPDHDALLVVTVRAVAFQTLEERRHHEHRGDDAHTGQPKTHGDRTHEARQHQADRQPEERGHPNNDAQFTRGAALEDDGLGVQPVTMGFGLAGVGVVATVLAMATLFQRLKRNRPDGYYQQHIVIWLHDNGLWRSALVGRSGSWDIGRTGYASLPLRDR